MKWYLVKLNYRIICGDGNHKPQFDEQLRMICAKDEHHAFEKARITGYLEEDAFLNNAEKLVQWKFIDITEIYPLQELTDGAEIFSRVYEEEDAENYIKIIKMRAANLLENSFSNIAFN